jgi:hypothetical protein
LALLLSRPFVGREELRQQLRAARVTAVCRCGCRSILLEVDHRLAPPAQVRRRIPIEATGADVDGMTIHLLLHVVGGYMTELEVFREDGEPLVALPAATELSLFSLDEE